MDPESDNIPDRYVQTCLFLRYYSGFWIRIAPFFNQYFFCISNPGEFVFELVFRILDKYQFQILSPDGDWS